MTPQTRRPLLPQLRLSAASLPRVLAAAAGAPFSYPDPGASAGAPPSGYRPIARSASVGEGRAAFDRLSQAVLGWQVHRDSGVAVLPAAPEAAPGVEVALGARTGGLLIVMACRVVYVLEEPNRRGFAYGSLPGHPEAGEESFVVDISDGGTVTFTVGGFSRPGTRVSALVAPIARVLAGRAIGRYLTAARAIANRADEKPG